MLRSQQQHHLAHILNKEDSIYHRRRRQNNKNMSLESCMIVLDRSEYMRNEDYVPSRLEAQQA